MLIRVTIRPKQDRQGDWSVDILGRFDREKALEALLYVAHHVPDRYKSLKMILFADKAHLSKYGREIASDRYVAFEWGPAPSYTYDIVKDVAENRRKPDLQKLKDAFTTSGNDIIPKREANVDLLSETDRAELDAAIQEYGHLSMDDLIILSHDKVYADTPRDQLIPVENFVKSVPGGEDLWDYLNSE